MSRGNAGQLGGYRAPNSGIVKLWEKQQAASGGLSQGFIKNSLRLRTGAYLKRTPTVAGNNTKFTLSWWGKRGTLAYSGGGIFLGNVYGQQYANFNQWGFQGERFFVSSGQYGVSTDYLIYTQGVFTDTNQFHHFMIAVDTSQSVAWRRMIMYYDGNICPFDASIPQGAGFFMNALSGNQFFGENMIVAEAHLIDGQQLTPASFQSNDGRNIPIKYTGAYGTNGWHMEFADTSALTIGSNVGLGKDTSGNGNYLNTTGVSITTGSTYDAFTDVPAGISGSLSTFASLDPRNNAVTTLSNCNLTASGATDLPTLSPSKGNWYFEVNGVAKTWTPPTAFPAASGDYNFGQRPLAGAIPSGYYLLNNYNMQLLGA